MKHLRSITVAAAVLATTSPAAMAACELTVEVGDTLEYSVTELTAEQSCDTVTVTLTHTGNLPAAAMGHNWVLTDDAANIQPIADAGMGAGLDGNYVPADDERVLAATAIVGGGESTSVEVPVGTMEPGEYVFFCSFPGHWTVMKGTFTIS